MTPPGPARGLIPNRTALEVCADDLAAMARAAGELTHLLTTRAPGSAAARVTVRRYTTAPVNLEILELLDTRPDSWGVLPILRGWVEVAQMSVAGSPGSDDLPGVCSWLTDALAELEGSLMWSAFAHEVHALAGRMIRALGEAATDVRPHHTGAAGCGHPIDTVGPSRFVCSGCGKSWTLLAVTLPEAAIRTGVPLRTLQSWARRNLLLEVPARSERRRMYDLDSIRSIADERKARH